ncbi:MAG TPA: hypothetical protein DGB32_05405 [Dehalococcoidia bacterium]|jgi:hypothetical protein|nr:hypothetical protein [Chloroflexota bacterium]HCV27741.1 hypothetical protein [Dehalococcoidia bacterium]
MFSTGRLFGNDRCGALVVLLWLGLLCVRLTNFSLTPALSHREREHRGDEVLSDANPARGLTPGTRLSSLEATASGIYAVGVKAGDAPYFESLSMMRLLEFAY